MMWSAAAERSGDAALGCFSFEISNFRSQILGRIQSGVAASLCRRTPKKNGLCGITACHAGFDLKLSR
jgi:hypothetical protein